MPVHIIAGLAKWFLTQAGIAVFGFMKQKISENMGLSTKPLTGREIDTLLDEHLHRLEERLSQRLIERMDEDRLVMLRSAINQLNMSAKMANMTALKQACLVNALGNFSNIASLPQQGQTGGIPNAQLTCLAYLGIAAIHMEMSEPIADIAKNIASAIYADPATAKLWFGNDLIERLLMICPKCGLENLPDAKFCQYDGYPLAGTGLTSTSRGTKTNHQTAIVAYCRCGHILIAGSTFCTLCGRTISASYCSKGHANALGATKCSHCGSALPFFL